jgi:hypothetical protein
MTSTTYSPPPAGGGDWIGRYGGWILALLLLALLLSAIQLVTLFTVRPRMRTHHRNAAPRRLLNACIMRTTLTIDDDVYEAASADARATGRPLGRVLSEMARSAIEPRHPSPARFATFNVPKGSRMISAARIQKALNGEGEC